MVEMLFFVIAALKGGEQCIRRVHTFFSCLLLRILCGNLGVSGIVLERPSKRMGYYLITTMNFKLTHDFSQQTVPRSICGAWLRPNKSHSSVHLFPFQMN